VTFEQVEDAEKLIAREVYVQCTMKQLELVVK